jgi:DNA ligase (NAD+)
LCIGWEGLAIGDEVGVIKAKLIIPQIVIVYARHGGTPIEEPEVCPFCGTRVVHRRSPAAATEDGDILCCPNPKDHERIAQQIAFLADRSVLNIDQLSIGNARLLVQAFPEAAEEYGAYFIFRLSQEEIKKCADPSGCAAQDGQAAQG